MKGKFRKFLSVLLTASMVSSLFSGTVMGQGTRSLFEGNKVPRLIVSDTYAGDDTAGYQDVDVSLASPANAAIATDSDYRFYASPSDALDVSINGGEMHLQVKDGYDRATMSNATMSNATQRVSVTLNADGKTYQGKVDLVANWFRYLYKTLDDPTKDTVDLYRYDHNNDNSSTKRMGLASASDCRYRMTNVGAGDISSGKDVLVGAGADDHIILDFEGTERNILQNFRFELYDKEKKLLGYCYVKVYPRPTLEINGQPVSGVKSVESYITSLDESSRADVKHLAISGGIMKDSDWSSIKQLKNLQKLEVADDIYTSKELPANALENMTSLETVSLNAASKDETAGPRSTNGETGIMRIGSSAFKGCTSLTTVEIPGVEVVGARAFEDCTALQTGVFQNLLQIYSYAFANCTSLNTLKLPNVNLISSFSFQNCRNLENIMLPATPPFLLSFDETDCFDGVTLPLPTYTLADGDMNPLTGVELQYSLDIYRRNQAWCEILGLSNPDTPDTPDTKGIITFSLEMNGEYKGLVSGDNMKACLDKVLANNPGSSYSDINRIDGVSGTVTTNDWNTIEQLTGLMVLDIGTSAVTTQLEGAIPEGLKMPKSLTRFALYSTNDVELPAGMFEGCAGLYSVVMNRVTKIGSRAFAGCMALGSNDFRLPDVPPVLGDDVFAGITIYKGSLHTMSGTDETLANYSKAGGQWLAWLEGTPAPQPQPQPKPQSGGSSSSSASQSGKWVLNDHGWWYDYGNSLWPSNQWSYLYYNGRSDWYYFDAEGYLVTGWYTDAEGRTYYLHPLADGRRGYMYTGWNQIDGVWYYFSTESGDSNGMLLKNTVTPDGYRVDENGAWVQ